MFYRLGPFSSLLLVMTQIYAEYPDCYTCTIFNRRACCNSENQRCCNLVQRNDLECPSNASRANPECKRFRCLADGQCPPGYKCCPSPQKVCIPNGLIPPANPAFQPVGVTEGSLQCPLSLSATLLSSLTSCDPQGECATSQTCCPLPTAINMGCCFKTADRDLGTSTEKTSSGSTDKGLITSTEKSLTASTENGLTASTQNGLTASTENGLTASTENGLITSTENGLIPSTEDVNTTTETSLSTSTDQDVNTSTTATNTTSSNSTAT